MKEKSSEDTSKEGVMLRSMSSPNMANAERSSRRLKRRASLGSTDEIDEEEESRMSGNPDTLLAGRPKRNIISKKMDFASGLSWKEENDLKKALYASLQESKKREPGMLQPPMVPKIVTAGKSGLKRSNSWTPKQTDESSQDSLISCRNYENNTAEKDSLYKAKVHAQRKFAQGSRPNSPNVTPIKVRHTPKKFFTTKKAKTEDFLTFLCLRGSQTLPAHMDFYNMEDSDENGSSAPGTPRLSLTGSRPGTPGLLGRIVSCGPVSRPDSPDRDISSFSLELGVRPLSACVEKQSTAPAEIKKKVTQKKFSPSVKSKPKRITFKVNDSHASVEDGRKPNAALKPPDDVKKRKDNSRTLNPVIPLKRVKNETAVEKVHKTKTCKEISRSEKKKYSKNGKELLKRKHKILQRNAGKEMGLMLIKHAKNTANKADKKKKQILTRSAAAAALRAGETLDLNRTAVHKTSNPSSTPSTPTSKQRLKLPPPKSPRVEKTSESKAESQPESSKKTEEIKSKKTEEVSKKHSEKHKEKKHETPSKEKDIVVKKRPGRPPKSRSFGVLKVKLPGMKKSPEKLKSLEKVKESAKESAGSSSKPEVRATRQQKMRSRSAPVHYAEMDMDDLEVTFKAEVDFMSSDEEVEDTRSVRSGLSAKSSGSAKSNISKSSTKVDAKKVAKKSTPSKALPESTKRKPEPPPPPKTVVMPQPKSKTDKEKEKDKDTSTGRNAVSAPYDKVRELLAARKTAGIIPPPSPVVANKLTKLATRPMSPVVIKQEPGTAKPVTRMGSGIPDVPKRVTSPTPVLRATLRESFPNPTDKARIADVPTYHPSAESFNDPIVYIDTIRMDAEPFGMCRIIPPDGWKPECRINDDLKFFTHVQYIHRMQNRWGPNSIQMECIKRHLESQAVKLEPPIVGGVELDLAFLYETVHKLGGVQYIINKNKWSKVADILKIPKGAQERHTRLYDIYCKLLLSYDTLDEEAKTKLEQQVQAQMARSASKVDCVCKGRRRSRQLGEFFKLSRNLQTMWFKDDPTAKQVEVEYWRIVKESKYHVAAQGAQVDTKICGSGFPTKKDCPSNVSPYSRHGWNFNILQHNNASILKNLGQISGVTCPTLHISMLFTTSCWSRNQHRLPYVVYNHTGADIIWYSIPGSEEEKFCNALKTLTPSLIENGKLWLPEESIMVSPQQLLEHQVSSGQVVLRQGEFLVVFPGTFTASISCGYNISESLHFATARWLPHGLKAAKECFNSFTPEKFSIERLLFRMAYNEKTPGETLHYLLPHLEHIIKEEIKQRKLLCEAGLKRMQRMPCTDTGGAKRSRQAADSSRDEENVCDISGKICYLSMVVNEAEDTTYSLTHGLTHVQRRKNLRNCYVSFRFSDEEMQSLLDHIRQRLSSGCSPAKKKKLKVASSSSSGEL